MEENKQVIYIEKTFNARIDQVWKAWTEPTLIMVWFGSDPLGIVLKANLNVIPGGYFEITFQDADQTVHTCGGIYQDVQEFNKLSFTWTWRSEPGVESLVTLYLTESGEATHMKFVHENTGTESNHTYYNGWQKTFSKLDRMLNPGFESKTL